MPIATVISYLPRQRPKDDTLHILARAHRSAFGQFIRSEGNDNLAAIDADACASCLALLPALTREGMADKGEVLRDRMSTYGSFAELLADGSDADKALLCSFATDALALGDA